MEVLSYCLGVLLASYSCVLLFCKDRKRNVTTLRHLILATLFTHFVLVGYVPMIIWKEHYSVMFAFAITLFQISTSLIAFHVLQLYGDCSQKGANMLLAVLVLVVGHMFRYLFQMNFMGSQDPVTYQSLLLGLVKSVSRLNQY